MGELAIRRTRGGAVPQYQAVSKPEKQTGGTQSQKVTGSAGFVVSETLRQLMTRVSQAESHIRESRRTLQKGESVLDEVQDGLGRAAELARKSAGEGTPDRTALQAELEQLQKDIDRMIGAAAAGDTKLFLDADTAVEDGVEALLYAVMDGMSAKQTAAQEIPEWLVKGITQGSITPEQILAGLGLDKTASGAQLLAAIANSSLEKNSAAGCLAALYLGAVIAGGGSSEHVSLEDALDGLRQLLDQVAEGVPLDRAVETLTNGEFTSLFDFQSQFTGGTAPGLEEFLVNLLLSEGGSAVLTGTPVLTLLAGIEGINLELVMGLLNTAQTAQATSEIGAGPQAGSAGSSIVQFGELQVMGRDLTGVSFQSATGELILSGTEPVSVLGTGGEHQTIRITGSGEVRLQNVSVEELMVDSAQSRIFLSGENRLERLQLREGADITFCGGGIVKIGTLRGSVSNVLRLTEGAAAVVEKPEDGPGALKIPILLDGPVSLAAQASRVSNFAGKQLEPFDVIWKTLLPGWSGVTALTVDGRQAKMSLMGGDYPDAVRLWLAKNDPSHGHPLHTLIFRGRDELGRMKTRYAYLRWNQNRRAFQETHMYPNPFTITGGEADRDWIYEEDSHTLRIRSNQVTAISGGSGTDGNQVPFSGRIVLEDGIGEMELTLGGVVCRVSAGRAFHLGRKNDVRLVLQNGSENHFESGVGYAGISLGDGTSLSIDCAGDAGSPAGALTATGSTGGAGIGRDSGGGRDQASRILILGGVITATGTGGGAGIGAGKRGSIGAITILGGTVTAVATCHAAAIGAGVQGECGDILIAGTARIVKALGGNPGADIGGCLFGGCGTVNVSGGADIGGARLQPQGGIPLQIGEDTVTLPQFRLSSRALQLDKLNVLTREGARAAGPAIDTGRRWVAQIQAVYDALYGRLEQNFNTLHSVHRYIAGDEGLVRDTAAASTLLEDVRQSDHFQPRQFMRMQSRGWAENLLQLLQ